MTRAFSRGGSSRRGLDREFSIHQNCHRVQSNSDVEVVYVSSRLVLVDVNQIGIGEGFSNSLVHRKSKSSPVTTLKEATFGFGLSSKGSSYENTYRNGVRYFPSDL